MSTEEKYNDVLISELTQKYDIDTSQVTEKYTVLTGEILVLFINILNQIHNLEKEIFEKYEKLKNPKEPYQTQPGEKELWEEFKEKRKEIIYKVSIKPNDIGSLSFGNPTKYEYLNYPDTKIKLSLKSSKRAVIETYFEDGIKQKEQFILRNQDGNWKFDIKKYGFQSEDKWYKTDL